MKVGLILNVFKDANKHVPVNVMKMEFEFKNPQEYSASSEFFKRALINVARQSKC